MVKIILGVLAGHITWAILWVGFNAILTSTGLLPTEDRVPVTSGLALALLLAASIVFSGLAGYLAALIAPARKYQAALALGALQLAVGLFFQMQMWDLLPLWYHLPFLAMLVPMVFVGARLRPVESISPKPVAAAIS